MLSGSQVLTMRIGLSSKLNKEVVYLGNEQITVVLPTTNQKIKSTSSKKALIFSVICSIRFPKQILVFLKHE